MQGILLTRASGILSPICWLLGVIMNAIFNVLDLIGIPNVGLAILLFTLIVYLCMLPLNIKQQKFSKLSAIMNPELQAIQKKYKGKSDNASMQAQQAETKAVYAKYGVSASGSCVQLIIQLPILFSLYRIIYAMPAYVTKLKDAYMGLVSQLATMDGVSEILQGFTGSSRYASQFTNDAFVSGNLEYIQNTYIDCLNMASSSDWQTLASAFPKLSATINSTFDVISKYNDFLGINIANTPSFLLREGWSNGAYLMCVAAILVPVLAAVTQWLNYKLMPQQPNSGGDGTDMASSMANSMKTMNLIMPLFSAWLCFSLSVGIGIYWIGGAVFRSIEQVFINRYIDKTLDYKKLIEENKEKAEEKNAKYKAKQAKRNEIYGNLENQANQTTKKISTRANIENTYQMSKEEREAKLKEAQKYEKKGSPSISTGSSLAAHANMVRDYNEANRKNTANTNSSNKKNSGNK